MDIRCPRCDERLAIPDSFVSIGEGSVLCCSKCNEKFDIHEPFLVARALGWYDEAAGGSPEAQFNLGMAYYKGEGVGRSEAKALEWLSIASKAGHAKASYQMGRIYEEQLDWQNAVFLYWEAVAVAMPEALMDLGFLLLQLRHRKTPVSLPELVVARYGSDNCGVRLLEEVAQSTTPYNVDAACLLEFCYSAGFGVEKDPSKANNYWKAKARFSRGETPYKIAQAYEMMDDSATGFKYYRISARMGCVKAQFRLGWAYSDGWGDDIKANPMESYRWYLEAARQGCLDSMDSIGDIFRWGEGFEKDPVVAVEWYRKAAKRGCEFSQVKLGDCYYKGEGVNQDYEEACRWYSLAATNGHIDAQYSLGKCYLVGSGVAKDEKKGFQLVLRAAEQGHDRAMLQAGACLKSGFGCDRNYEEAIKWFLKVEEKDSDLIAMSAAEFELGQCIQRGLGGDMSVQDAIVWYTKSAKNGNPHAMFLLGECYRKGDGVPKDEVKAAKLYKGVASWRLAEGEYQYAVCLLNGVGVPKNEIEAVKYLTKAAEHGHKEAKLDLEFCQRHGIGTASQAADSSKSITKKDSAPASVVSHETATKKPATIRIKRPRIIREPTREQKTEIGRVADSIIGGSGIRGASFSEDADNPFSFIMFIPITTPERLVVDACAKLFLHLGLVSSGEVLTMGRYLDYCGVVRGGTSDGECYVASFNHPMAKIIGSGSPQARYILKNWINGDDDD